MPDENRPGPVLRFVEPDEAMAFVRSLSLRRLNYLLWDLPPVAPESAWRDAGYLPEEAERIFRADYRERMKVWRYILERSAEIALWSLAGAPLGLLWGLPISLGCEALAVHFCFATRGREFFPAMIGQCLAATKASALMGLLPANYQGVREAIEKAGFRLIAKIPKACAIARANKTVDGLLYYIEPAKARRSAAR